MTSGIAKSRMRLPWRCAASRTYLLTGKVREMWCLGAKKFEPRTTEPNESTNVEPRTFERPNLEPRTANLEPRTYGFLKLAASGKPVAFASSARVNTCPTAYLRPLMNHVG